MPHGGGHHGGGGFGGGGFGGGHHHHHHGGFHHHHHHHHGTSGVVFTGGYYGYYRRRRGGCFILGLIAVGLFVGAFVGLGFGIHGSYVGGSAADSSYSPGDTRLYSYSPFFCMGGDLDYGNLSPDPENASLYLLPSKPPLKHTNSFYVNKTNIQISSDYWKHWSFYLYPGSQIVVFACAEDSLQNFDLHLIRGNGNYKSWDNNPRSKYVITTEKVLPCSSNPSTKKIIYKVQSEDMYYVVLENNYYISAEATLSLHVNRTGYVPNGTPNCTGVTGCSYYTSDNKIKYALVTTSDPTDSDWERNIEVYYSCVPLIANYVLVTVVPFLAVVGLCIAVVVVISICVVVKRKKRTGYQTLDSSLPAVTVQPTEPSKPAPPPYNPSAPGTAPPPPYAPY